MAKINKRANRIARHARVRKKISGTAERPRLNIYRSNANIYAQIIDDESGKTLVSASTLDKDLKTDFGGKSNTDSAKAVGKLVAQRALDAGIKQVVFDRSGYIYHGRVAALAGAARETGLVL